MIEKLCLSFLLVVLLSGCGATLEGVREDIDGMLNTNDSSSSMSSDGETGEASETSQMETAMVDADAGKNNAALVMDIEETLSELGYEPGTIDGEFDPKTEAAIQDFQLDNDLAIDGKPTRALLEKMKTRL